MARTAWELTEEHIRHLNACSAQGMGICAAARELGVDMKTVKSAAARAGKAAWLQEKFPGIGKRRVGLSTIPYRGFGPRQITMDDLHRSPPVVDTSLLHVKVAIMSWRAAA
ncbi:hypothetical protein, partial [Marinobacter sp.]|uniref:hypothetical protein n=1 Tax=Marinobacter sp. TaxID=50741 RepID=UPI003563FA8E